MTAPIGPGDFIECVDAGPMRPGVEPSGLVAGKIYTVRGVDVVPDKFTNAGEPIVLLVEVCPPVETDGYDPARFRPVYRRDETLTARLLSDIPADAPASPEEVVA